MQEIHCIIIKVIPAGETNKNCDPSDIKTILIEVDLQKDVPSKELQSDLVVLLGKILSDSKRVYDLTFST